MNFLKDFIREEKILEIDTDIEKFLEENNISDRAIIHKVILGKERFQTEEEAREYLKSKYFWDYNIEENDNEFIAVAISEKQISPTETKVTLGRDVVGFIGELIEVPCCQEISFNDKGEVNLSSEFKTIDLHEGLPHIIEIARVAEGEHPIHGRLVITQEHLESMESNFKSKVTGVDLSINEDHKKNEAFGWFKDVFLSFDKQTLYAQVMWNTKGITALSEKEYRYFSPEFRFSYKHPHSGEKFGATLVGGALTNYPFLKMDAIVELNNKSQGAEKVTTETTIELSVHNEKIVELNNKVSEVQGKLDAEEAKNVELSDKVKELEDKITKSDKEKVHDKLFAEGKINKAQLVALNEGKDMLEVLSLNEKMNTKAKGSDETPEDDEIVLSAKEKEIAEQLGLTDKEYVEYNK